MGQPAQQVVKVLVEGLVRCLWAQKWHSPRLQPGRGVAGQGQHGRIQQCVGSPAAEGRIAIAAHADTVVDAVNIVLEVVLLADVAQLVLHNADKYAPEHVTV
jgi:hypothetical protein